MMYENEIGLNYYDDANNNYNNNKGTAYTSPIDPAYR